MRHAFTVCLIALCASRTSAQPAADGGDKPAAANPESAGRAGSGSGLGDHSPRSLNEVLASDARLVFGVDAPDRAGAIVVHAVSLDKTVEPFEGVAAREGDFGYAVQLPAACVVPPGFGYWVSERMPDGSERPVFADAAHPHRVRVSRSEEDEAEHRRLLRRRGQRSMLIVSGEGVDYGRRRLVSGTPRQYDRYYRFEVGYAYAFLTRVEEVRLTLVRVRGEAGSYLESPAPTSVEEHPGIDYGRAAVTLLASDMVRLQTALLFGASQRGFAYGGGGTLVLGDPRDTHLDLGAEAIRTVGATAHLRLGFLAAPRIPMGAAIEVSTLPVGDDPGVRLLYDVGYFFGPVTELRLRGGYQGRTSVSGVRHSHSSFATGFELVPVRGSAAAVHIV